LKKIYSKKSLKKLKRRFIPIQKNKKSAFKKKEEKKNKIYTKNNFKNPKENLFFYLKNKRSTLKKILLIRLIKK
jgi:hypothetical protein